MNILLALLVTSLPASAGLYDSPNFYQNPLEQLTPGCAASVHLFQVYRPIMPLVTHTFIGAVVSTRCPGEETAEVLEIYGASKGASDLSVFRERLAQPDSDLEDLGTASGEQALAVLTSSRATSLVWAEWLSNTAFFSVRMVATPLLGRPCADAAAEVRGNIAPLLTPPSP